MDSSKIMPTEGVGVKNCKNLKRSSIDFCHSVSFDGNYRCRYKGTFFFEEALGFQNIEELRCLRNLA